MSDGDETRWMRDETESIQVYLLSEVKRIETGINERFAALSGRLNGQRTKPEDTATRKSSQDRIRGARVFLPRNSLLTDLFQISHFRSLRNVFAAILIIFVTQVSLNDLTERGSLNLDFDLIFQSFANFHIALLVWLGMQLCTAVVVFVGLHSWMGNRANGWQHLRLYDTVWSLVYVTYAILFLILPCRQIVKHQLPVACSAFVLLEQLRQLMKTHSFVREKIGQVLVSVVEPTDFSQYLYFLFAPTLIYRDSYPRTSNVRWSFVLEMLGQVLAAIVCAYYVVVRFCVPTFENLNQNEITLPIFISVLFNSVMPGSLFLLLTFYGFVHCWLNAFAEMLRFADRMFYQDWWNSTSFAFYYRTWNIVVHDWLYTYVYQDVYTLTGRRSRTFPSICVMLLSAVFHEYVMIFALGFFYPVMFLLFGVVGLLFLFLVPRSRSVIYNVLIWLFILLGVGFQSCLYFMESYARKSCATNNTWWDKIIPRSFMCQISIVPKDFLRSDL